MTVRLPRPKKKRRITKRPEQVAHIAVIDHLRVSLPVGAMVWHTPNAAKRGHAERHYLRRMALIPGFPDIAILYEGRLYVAEMKAPKGETTDAQDQCITDLVKAGATFLGIWQSIDDCHVACLSAHLPMRSVPFGKGFIRPPANERGDHEQTDHQPAPPARRRRKTTGAG